MKRACLVKTQKVIIKVRVPYDNFQTDNFNQMKFKVKHFSNLYHHFGKGLFECWIN